MVDVKQIVQRGTLGVLGGWLLTRDPSQALDLGVTNSVSGAVTDYLWKDKQPCCLQCSGQSDPKDMQFRMLTQLAVAAAGAALTGESVKNTLIVSAGTLALQAPWAFELGGGVLDKGPISSSGRKWF